MHLFGPLDSYPGVADSRYNYPGGDPEHYEALAKTLGIDRMVLVQSSFYGSDNRFLLKALANLGQRGRAVVFLPDDPRAALLDALHARGVRGLRLDFFKMRDHGASVSEYEAALSDAARLARSMHWHIELYSPGTIVRDLMNYLADMRIPVCVNHMGYMKAAEGVTDHDFDRFVATLACESIWVKLTGPYRLSEDGDSARADSMARRLIEAAPRQLVWGTDWPHIPECGLDTGDLLARLAHWCPEEVLRNSILVDNPARLYGF